MIQTQYTNLRTTIRLHGTLPVEINLGNPSPATKFHIGPIPVMKIKERHH